MIQLSGRGDTREMAGEVDETRFSGIEPWKNSTSPYPESPWRRLNPSYVISNGIRRLSPHIQTNPPPRTSYQLNTSNLQLEYLRFLQTQFPEINCVKFVSKRPFERPIVRALARRGCRKKACKQRSGKCRISPSRIGTELNVPPL